MKVVAILLLIALPSEAAQTPLAFSARIQSEKLAEEAIDLLHCVADTLDLPWELNEESQAPYRLKVEERGGQLSGEYRSPEGQTPFALKPGEANKVCGDLFPEKERPSSSLELPRQGPETDAKDNTWIWVGATAALLAGGYFLWKSRPSHRSIRME
jgi:hypothetical protein